MKINELNEHLQEAAMYLQDLNEEQIQALLALLKAMIKRESQDQGAALISPNGN